MFMNQNATQERSKIIAIIAACGMSLAAASFTVTTHAQNQQDHMEWEPDEGFHEEEWYDPSDWFDDDFDGISGPDTDYEYDNNYGWTDNGYDYDGEYYATYNNQEYDSDWWYDADRSIYNHGYYDGYSDGYDSYDASYNDMKQRNQSSNANGNNANTGENRYSSGYLAGYMDGRYDKDRGYQSDWTYYIYSVPVADNQTAQKQSERNGDTSRKRGDRASEARTHEMNAAQASKDAQKTRDRVRGTVAKVEQLKKERLAEKLKDNTVLRLTMEDGKQIVVDLGPNAKNNVIESGDRVTLIGQRKERSGRTVLDATRLSINDQIMWNTNGQGEPTRADRG